MQLMQPFVQKWTTTTFPFWSASLRGPEFIQSVTPVNSGAATGVGAPSVAGGRPGFGSRSNPQPATTQTPRLNPNSSTITTGPLAFIVDLRVCDLENKCTFRT